METSTWREDDDHSITTVICTIGNQHCRPSTSSQVFKSFCLNLNIKNQFPSPSHPLANSQIEVTNQTLLKIIKVRLKGVKGAWPKEFPNVLWAYQTTEKTPNKRNAIQTYLWHQSSNPYRDRGHKPKKRFFFQEKCNDDELKMNLDCLDEARGEASQRMEKYQQKMASYYNQSRLQVDSVNIKSPKGGRTTKVAYGRTV